MKYFCRNKVSLISIGFLLLVAQVRGQSALRIGEWANYFPLMKTNGLAKGNGIIWVGCDYGMFRFDYRDNSLESFRTYSDFAGFEVSKIGFNSEKKSFVISYKNGDLDIVDNNRKVTTMSDLRRTLILGNKSANHFFNYKQLCFVSTDIGLVVIDVSTKKVLESYTNVSPNAQSTTAAMSAIVNDTLYLQENNGRILYVPYVSNLNKMDFKNWKVITNESGLTETIIHTFSSSNDLFVVTQSKKLFKKNGRLFEQQSYQGIESDLKKVKALENGRIAFIYSSTVQITNSSGDLIITIPRDDVTDIEVDGDTYFISTMDKGLVKFSNNQFSKPIYPNSPYSISFRNVCFDGSNAYFMPSVYRNSTGAVPIQPLVLSVFDGKEWTNISRETHPQFVYTDAYHGLVLDDSLYFTHFDGLAIVNKKDFKGRNIPKTGAPFNNTGITNNGPFYVSLVKKDDNKNIYTTGFLPGLSTLPIFHKWNARTQQWTSTSLPFPGARIMLDMVIDNGGNKWIMSSHAAQESNSNIINGEGLIVYNEVTGISKRLTKEIGNGNLTSTKLYCLEKARNGEIWVGTDDGISVFFNPERVLTSNSGWDASVPVYDSRALMREKSVTAIKSDAADRKWIGTLSEGVWLFSADGSQLIYNFNTANSPLPSDNIFTLDINPNNGEVLISTDKGIAVFREGVTDVSNNEGEMNIFPNPVYPDFNGKITIDALGQDAVVKITDISGKLIHQTQALGATAFWDGKDLSGRRAKTGIYLVYSSTKEGNDRLVGKLMIIE